MKLKYLFLLASIFVVSVGAGAHTVDQDGVLRDDQGKVLTMNQADAIKACAKHGMHLPTILELVKLSQLAGITLKELSEGSEGEIRIGPMKLISAVNRNGKTDFFQYSNDNYTPPSGDLGSNSFWSSSVGLEGSYYGYGLSGFNGYVFEEYRYYDYHDAVRCVVAQ